MQLHNISITFPDCRSGDISLDDFKKSHYAESLLGKLFLALLQENDWSSELNLHGSFHSDDEKKDDFIQVIGGPFQNNNGTSSFGISKSMETLTVNEVALLIIDEYKKHSMSVMSVIETLQGIDRGIKDSARAIEVGLAKRYIANKFPLLSLTWKNCDVIASRYTFFMDQENNRFLYVETPVDTLNGTTQIYQRTFPEGFPQFPYPEIMEDMREGKRKLAE